MVTDEELAEIRALLDIMEYGDLHIKKHAGQILRYDLSPTKVLKPGAVQGMLDKIRTSGRLFLNEDGEG